MQLLGFGRVAAWRLHLVLLGATAAISWAVWASGDSGSPYPIFFAAVAVCAALFFGRWGAIIQVAAMLAAYAAALVALGDDATTPVLHWALTAAALLLLAVAMQALTRRLAQLVDRLSEVGRSDSLTGLYNAAAFTEMLDNEIERARRSGNRLGIVIAELDDFAALTSGSMPAPQQELLGMVAAIFRSTPRQIDMCARLGGGRFALLLPYTDEHGGFLLAERIRERIAPLGAGRTRMSFGVAGFPRAGASAQSLFQGAEIALAEAREQGGDRVVIFQRSTVSARVEIDLPEPEAAEPQLG